MWQDSSAQCPPSGCRKSHRHSRSQSQSQRCCSWRRQRGQTQHLGLTGINVMRPILPFCRCTLCGCCMPATNTTPPHPAPCCRPIGKLLKSPFKSWHRCVHLRQRYEFKRKLILFPVNQGKSRQLLGGACCMWLCGTTMPQVFASTLTYFRVTFAHDSLVIHNNSFPRLVEFSISVSA